MFELCVSSHFDAAHKLPNYKGKCANLHGHTFRYEVVLKGGFLHESMLVDFVLVKAAMQKYVENSLDHSYLNESLSPAFVPTAENLAEVIYKRLAVLSFTPYQASVVKVTVWESSECSAVYYED
jgi:6-pyruvoyltetrahydropterin/6-carboxytetrahydropterin synthase